MDKKVVEWRNINWDLEDDHSMDISLGIMKLFDW